MFTILPEFEKQYKRYVDLGQKFLKNQRITVVGLARNIESILYDNVYSIDSLRDYCSNLSYFIYENDSEDLTPSILDRLQHNIKNFNYRSDSLGLKSFEYKKLENKLDLKSIERTTNLAQHRNICIDYITSNKQTDFVMVMDLDFAKFSLDGILNSFGWLSENYTDAVVGSSFEMKPLFMQNKTNLWNYDCWAYRGSWWDDLQKYSQSYGYDPMLWFGFWQPPIGSDPIPVNSAFGGAGIYRTEQFIRAKYDGYDCEHVCFHKNLKDIIQNFRLCLNPSQLMLFP